MRLSTAQIETLLSEDVPCGDLTTRSLGIAGRMGRMTFTARQAMVLCGVEEAVRLLTVAGAEVRTMRVSGQACEEGVLLLEASGTAEALFAGWKAAQTLVEWASGVATATQRIISAARKASPAIKVLCTRKSIPFTKALSVKAVLAGGGDMHRLGLSDSIMLFPEYHGFAHPDCDFRSMIGALKARMPEQAVMVEVKSFEDAVAASEAMADVIQLEKFDPAAVERVVSAIPKRADGRPTIAAAGGINAANAETYARVGVDTLVTSAPFYAPPADVQVVISPTD